jgi:lipoprotein-releasing system ATP-binding protein
MVVMAVMLRAENLAKIYPAVSGRGARAGEADSSAALRNDKQKRGGAADAAGIRAERRADGKNGAWGEVVLFRGLSFEVKAGEMVAIVGESGSGKSSLLHLLAALDRPTEGDVWVGEADAEIRLGGLNAKAAAEFRNRKVGYVWQFHYLLPEFTALENVAMPLLARGESKTSALEKARRWLGEVGLTGRAEHRSGELSGGEQQRVSLARALVTEPKLLLADEPTGDLDGKTGEAVFELIRKIHGEHLLTSVLVTHNMEFASRCGRVMRLRDGRLEEVV